jgi:hypothetical protein
LTESDWLSCDEPQKMLLFLRNGGKVSERKLRLLLVAMCRRLWPWLREERHRHTVEVPELYADGLATGGTLRATHSELPDGVVGSPLEDEAFFAETEVWHVKYGPPRGTANEVATAAERAADARHVYRVWLLSVHAVDVPLQLYNLELLARDPEDEGEDWCSLLRDVFGPLPFKPVNFDTAWRTPTVMAAARRVYDERHLPSGTLDASLLRMLGGALEDAGASAELWGHLWQDGAVHVRGCWVVDLLLNKE